MYQYQKRHQGNITLIDVTPMPDWQEFEQFLNQFVEQENAQLLNKDLGMDRHQARLIIANKRYLMHFEHYTNSIWLDEDN